MKAILQAGVARLGSMSHCPRVRLRQQELVWQSLNHHEGFIISWSMEYELRNDR